MLVHMCIALIALYIVFLVAQHGQYYDDIEGFCYFVSALLQYFLLIYLFWTVIEAFYLYRKLVMVFANEIRHFVFKAFLFAWGM